MVDDDGNQEPEKGLTLSDVEDVVRRVLGEVMPGKTPDLDLDPDDDDDEGDPKVYTVRQAEEIAERAVRKAMKTLKAAKPKAAPAKASDDDDDDDDDDGASGSGAGSSKPKPKPREPAPTPPKETVPAWRLRMKELLVGAD